MSFRLRHEWTEGATLPALHTVTTAELATCEHCETLRVTEGEEVTYLRRAEKDEDRVLTKEPPCISPGTPFRAPW